MTTNIFMRWKTFVSLIAMGSLLSSCLETNPADLELDTIVTIESFSSPGLTKAGVIENPFYPCVNTPNCEPKVIQSAVMSLTGERSGEFVLDRIIVSEDLTIFQNEFTHFLGGEEVTMNVRIPNRKYAATSTMPENLDVIEKMDYIIDSTGSGLVLFLDSTEFEKSAGLHILIVKDQAPEPIYGFLVTRAQLSFSECFFYGAFVEPYIFVIPDEEVRKTGVELSPDDVYYLDIRNSTPESIEYYHAYNQSLCGEPMDGGNGTEFAPPENLPTNFNNGAFGFFHLFTQEHETGIVRKR